MPDTPRELVTRFLAGEISAEDLRVSVAGLLRPDREQASERVGRVLAVLDRHRDGLLTEDGVRLELIPHASWAYSNGLEVLAGRGVADRPARLGRRAS